RTCARSRARWRCDARARGACGPRDPRRNRRTPPAPRATPSARGTRPWRARGGGARRATLLLLLALALEIGTMGALVRLDVHEASLGVADGVELLAGGAAVRRAAGSLAGHRLLRVGGKAGFPQGTAWCTSRHDPVSPLPAP